MRYNNDVRVRTVRSCVMASYKGHCQEVCGLKWSGSGQRRASGGNDSLVHIWDRSSSTQHTSAAKALAWCPFQSNLLASGGGEEDRKIKFWNTQTGACLNSVDTGSSQLTLWKYPSMVKVAELSGHTSRVLSITQCPDGCTCTVVSSSRRRDSELVSRFLMWLVFDETVKASLQGKPLIDN
ncbi:hypothetical protein HID58_085162 [Brassica napus]|uniref:Uncharacterized protein n=1 Tax=Brassica napus TaxID=3708 RepID=A0ABQ7XPC0_BRANA|nr:hypothetical protein HID58_085162 [Brassica napus]